MANVLIFRVGSIGDTIVAVPAFHQIRNSHFGDKITLLTNSPTGGNLKIAASYQLLLGSGLIDDYIEYPNNIFNIKYAKDIEPESTQKQELLTKADELIKQSEELVKKAEEIKKEANNL